MQEMKIPEHLKIFISGSFISIFGNVLLGGANYLTRRTFSVNLSQFDYGCFYGVFSLISLVLIFLDLGVNDAGTVLISSYPERRKKIFFTLWKWKGVAGILCVIILAVLSPFISSKYLHASKPWLIFFLSLYVLFQTLNGTILSYTSGCKQFKMKSVFQVVKAFLLLGAAVVLTEKYGVTGAALAYALSALVMEPFHMWWVCRSEKKCANAPLDSNLRKSFLSLIGMVSTITFLQMQLMHTSSVFLMFLRGAESNAVFNIAQPVAQLFLSFMVFHQVFLPLAVEMVQNKEYGRLRIYAGGAVLITIAVLPVMYVVLRYTAYWLISLLFSRAYAEQAAVPLIILMTGFLFNALTSFLTQILIAMNETKMLLAGLISVLAVNAVFNYTLIKFMDVKGACWATTLSYLFFLLFLIIGFYISLKKKCRQEIGNAGVLPDDMNIRKTAYSNKSIL